MMQLEKSAVTKLRPIKFILEKIANNLPNITLASQLKGSNNSKQYNAEFKYHSLVTNTLNTISFEIGLREEVLENPTEAMADTILEDNL